MKKLPKSQPNNTELFSHLFHSFIFAQVQGEHQGKIFFTVLLFIFSSQYKIPSVESRYVNYEQNVHDIKLRKQSFSQNRKRQKQNSF